MNTIYKHELTIGSTTYEVHPIYKDDMAVDWQYEASQMFYRGNLSGKMNFVGDDANLIITAPFVTEFILKIYSSVDKGATWTLYHTSKFFKTDCTINIDNAKVTVKPSVVDQYNKILDGMDKEFNLIELAPVIESVEMVKRGVLQVYTKGDTKLTNIFGGISWEQDCDIEVDGAYDDRWGFKRCYDNIEMTIIGDGSLPHGLNGKFTGLRKEDGTFRLDNADGIYYIERRTRPLSSFYTEIKRVSDDDAVYLANQNDESLFLNFIRESPYDPELPYSLDTEGFEFGIYCRWLTDKETVILDGITYQTTPLQSDDPSYGGNYHYALGYTTATIVQSNRISTTPTQWGRKSQTEYFNTPDDNRYYIPVGRSQWLNYSMWYYQGTYEFYIEEQLRKYTSLRDAFPLWSVLDVLLTKLGTNITFQPTSVYSEFFYGTSNPLDGMNRTKPFITPKSNIIVGEYGEPAMKAPVTLGNILDMLKRAFGCYWFVDEQNRLRIEHISWFKNGGSYSMVHEVGYDLTTMMQPSTLKTWGFGVNEYTFDKEQMAARYQYKWMDDTTDIFDGKPMDIISPFVMTDKVEEINISNFTSDIDFMTVAPSMCSKDGFALLMAQYDGIRGVNYLPIWYKVVSGRTTVTQNWFASLTYLMPRFLTSDLPSWTYAIDGTTYGARGIQRGKKQKVKFPVGDTLQSLLKLVRTKVGDGQIERMSINMASNVATTNLKFDTYAAE